MYVVIERQGVMFLARLLDNSGYVMGLNDKPLKWFDKAFCKESLLDKGFIVLVEQSVYRGVTILKGSDYRFYTCFADGVHVLVDYTIKKEATAKQLIDWHRDHLG